LDDDFHVGFFHFVADFLVDDEAAVAVEDGAKEVKSAGDVEVTDIDVPVFMGLEGLDETGTFLGDVGRGAGEQSGFFENPIDAGGTTSDLIGIEHHEGQAAIAFEGMPAGKSADAEFFIVGEPVVTWDPGVVFVDLAEAFFPIVELAGADADPGQEATDRDFGLVAPAPDEIDELIADIVGDPAGL
jgi:hypothetical protein